MSIGKLEKSYFSDFDDDKYFTEDDSFEETGEDSEEAEVVYLEDFSRNFKSYAFNLAKQYIISFFSDKTMYCGGKIPKKILLTEKNIDIVLNYDIIKGVNLVYNSLKNQIKESSVSPVLGETTEDIVIVLETLKLLSKSGIPQELAGGMLILYLRWVEGYDIEES
jgi:hypothetical protein